MQYKIIKIDLKGMKNGILLNGRFVKFIFVGGFNALFGYSVFSLFIYLKFHYSMSALIATIIGVFFNFKTTGTIVFKNKRNSLIIKFIGVYSVVYLLNIAFLKVFAIFEYDMYIAGTTILLPMACISFWLNRALVFKEIK
ncbi:MAG: GtrA family protein [Thermodesulfovibrionales bacterium]